MSFPFQYLEDFVTTESQAVCIGVFDGVHRGHQALLAKGQTAHSGALTVLTFDPHPATVFVPEHTLEMLGTLTERAELLRRYGAKNVVVARFDRAFAARTASDFIENILVNRLNSATIVVGDDFRFGHERRGNIDVLRAAGTEYGFSVDCVPPVLVDGVPARSTTIRQRLTRGEVGAVIPLLGRPYCLSGTVVHGRKLGRTIGFPTANLETPAGILVPAAGVYAGIVRLPNGERRRTAISIGTNPTITPENQVRTVEAFVMDGFDGDLYGKTISVEFYSLLRPTLKFDSLEELIKRMNEDIKVAASRVPLP